MYLNIIKEEENSNCNENEAFGGITYPDKYHDCILLNRENKVITVTVLLNSEPVPIPNFKLCGKMQ